MTNSPSMPGFTPDTPDELRLALVHAQAEVLRLGQRERLFSMLLSSVDAVLWAYDRKARRIVYVSPAYGRVFGRSAARLMADPQEWRNAIYPDDLERATAFLEEGPSESASTCEYRIIRGDGELRWLSDRCFISQDAGYELLLVGITEDITEKKQLQDHLQRLATTDALTLSSNRRHFFECAQLAFAQARAQGTPLAFLLMDVDDFKQVNDRHGHPEGDRVLQQVARASSSVLRRGDLFGRVGGEEFAVLFPDCTQAQALPVAQRLEREIARLRLGEPGAHFCVSLSQGLVELSPQDISLEALFARADQAMYQAKRDGKRRIVTA